MDGQVAEREELAEVPAVELPESLRPPLLARLLRLDELLLLGMRRFRVIRVIRTDAHVRVIPDRE